MMMTRSTMIVAFVVLALALPGVCSAYVPVFMKLTINGNDAPGESTIRSLDREGTTELLSYEHRVELPIDRASGMATGRHVHGPVVVRKRLDCLTPLLMQALVTRQPVQATFMFYRPSVTGSGAEEKFLTVKLENGYVSGVEHLCAAEGPGEPRGFAIEEEVTFVFQDIRWEFMANGTVFHDSADGDVAATQGPAGNAPGKPRPGFGAVRPRINP